MIRNKFFLTLARTIDHRVGHTDDCKPDIPVLPMKYALASFFMRFVIVLINFVTCGIVIASIIHHW
jgi:hypothetical protein